VTPLMDPLVVDGVMRPDLDQRWVPRATMARYLNVSGETVYQRHLRGEFPADGIKRFGSRAWYWPALCVPAHPAAVAL
jgi:hypothetical protein